MNEADIKIEEYEERVRKDEQDLIRFFENDIVNEKAKAKTVLNQGKKNGEKTINCIQCKKEEKDVKIATKTKKQRKRSRPVKSEPNTDDKAREKKILSSCANKLNSNLHKDDTIDNQSKWHKTHNTTRKNSLEKENTRESGIRDGAWV